MTERFFGDELIDAALTAVTKSKITVAGTIRPCVIDRYHQDTLEQQGGAAQKQRLISVEVRTNNFPQMKQNDEVDVDGVRYTVWDQSDIGDGATRKLLLRVVEP